MLSNCLVSCLQEEVEPFPEERENFLQQLYKFMEDRGERGGDEIDVLFLGFFLFIYVVLITPFTFFWSYKYFFTLYTCSCFIRPDWIMSFSCCFTSIHSHCIVLTLVQLLRVRSDENLHRNT